MVTVPHEMVGLERLLDYRGVGSERFHCTVEPLIVDSLKQGHSVIDASTTPTTATKTDERCMI